MVVWQEGLISGSSPLIILKKSHCSSKDNGLWEEDCCSSCGKTVVPRARRCVIRNTRDGGLSGSCHELLASLELMIIKLLLVATMLSLLK
jgi:hypothetical protein